MQPQSVGEAGAAGMSLAACGPASALVEAAGWGLDLLLGRAGTTLAVLAVAAIGATMLRGHIPIHRGVSAILGCFVLFGAASIAQGLMAAAQPVQSVVAPPPAPPALAYTPTVPKADPYDPYAGAAVPGH